ncbi:MAG TPA: asparagine synthase-related protein, partial [Gemmatimonas sp.]|nr:asparagine synthase-related protein [Gemmatimonas sp.]
RTFSVGFDEADYDESGPAAAVAAHLGTDHSSIRLTGDDALRLVPSLPDWFDEPHADPSQLPTFLICREARREVTVAVSGDGGDELFGGYNRYLHGERALQRADRLGSAGRRAVAAGIGPLAPASWDRLARWLSPVTGTTGRHRDPGEKLHKLRDLMRQPTSALQYRALVSAGFQDAESLVRGGSDTEGGIAGAFAVDAPLGLMERMMLADQLEYLPDDLLAKVDRVSMATSLEVRVPLLDHDVAEFAWRLPRRFKVRGSETKWLLRQLLHARVPRALVDRGKMGFSVPIDRWLRGPLREWAESLLSDAALRRSGAIDAVVARARWEAFLRRDGRVSAMGIWALVNFQAWQERWI